MNRRPENRKLFRLRALRAPGAVWPGQSPRPCAARAARPTRA